MMHRPLAILRILFGVLLAISASVNGKGGGKSSGGKSSSGKSKGGGSTVPVTTTVNSGGTTVCYNENNQIIRCPPNSARKNTIIGAVIGGIVGSILLAFLIYWIYGRITRRIRDERQRKSGVVLPNIASIGKEDYKPLHDQPDDSRT
ncbi:hypothetical protein B0H15DRAFT_525063 [Mycena belliarum]|uniref:Uncharacterized protein n=1 Tax=Mycena belliarum TaxID=1033014 RepID=A0AAD6TVF4_9AGAR|nr:hypothetical protein B0H15DRAFT_525063 [Mycena belliae]